MLRSSSSSSDLVDRAEITEGVGDMMSGLFIMMGFGLVPYFVAKSFKACTFSSSTVFAVFGVSGFLDGTLPFPRDGYDLGA